MAIAGDPIGEFITVLRKTPSNKAPDGFWPVGVFRSRRASALVIERLKARAPIATMRFELAWSPSVLLNLYYSLALGSRAAGLPRSEAATFGRQILQGVLVGRSSGLINSDGTNRLTVMERVGGSLSFPPREAKGTERESRRLGALALAYAEAATFNGHRLVTEIHGPYLVGSAPAIVVRTVNLNMAAPFSSGFLPAYDRLHIVSLLRFENSITPRMFDIWGHPLFNDKSVRRESSWVVGVSGTDVSTFSADEIEACCADIRRDLEHRLTRVEGMTTAERCAELGRIMLWTAMTAIGVHRTDALTEAASFPRSVKPGERWTGDRSEFLEALDVRMEWTDADLFPRHP